MKRGSTISSASTIVKANLMKPFGKLRRPTSRVVTPAITGLALTLGLISGWDVGDQQNAPDGQNFYKLLQSVFEVKPMLSGSFLSIFYHILSHNLILSFVYGLASLLSLGLFGIASVYFNGIIFGQTLYADHSVWATSFVLLEILSFWWTAFIGTRIGWERTIRNKPVSVWTFFSMISVPLVTLPIAALIETTLIFTGGSQ